jgi:HTH-type transcriptional regulator/antitoxin HigA
VESEREANMTSERVVGAWEEFQAHSGGIRKPESEAQYLELVELLDDLTDRYDCNLEPYASLFDLLANYADEWEAENEPELKHPDVAPNQMLAYLMEDRGVSQYQIAQTGLVDQGNLSRILSGKRGVSKQLAKRLAEYFDVDPNLSI